MRLNTLRPRLQTLQPGRVVEQTAKQQYHHLYNSQRWRNERGEHLTAHPLCVMCEKEGRVTAATIVDHVEPHQGNEQLFRDHGNWQSLCKPHHDGEKQRQEREAGLR